MREVNAQIESSINTKKISVRFTRLGKLRNTERTTCLIATPNVEGI